MVDAVLGLQGESDAGAGSDTDGGHPRDTDDDAWRTDEAQKDRVHMDEVALSKYARTQDQNDPRDGEPAGRDSHRDGSHR